MIVTSESIQASIQARVKAEALSVRTLATISGIAHSTLTRKLASTECNFTVLEVAAIARSIGIKMEAFFEPVPSAEYQPYRQGNCPRYSFCKIDHTDPLNTDDEHALTLPYGIDINVDNLENDRICVNWMPNFNEWIMEPEAVPNELGSIRDLLAELPTIVAAVVREVRSPLTRRTEPGEPELAGVGGGL